MKTKILASTLLAALAVSSLVVAQTPAAPSARYSAKYEKLTLPAGFTNMLVLIDFPAGSTFPLHSHGGPVLALVVAGELTLRQDGKTTTYKAGESFVEPVGQQHEATNLTKATTTVAVSYLLPAGAEPDIIVKK